MPSLPLGEHVSGGVVKVVCLDGRNTHCARVAPQDVSHKVPHPGWGTAGQAGQLGLLVGGRIQLLCPSGRGRGSSRRGTEGIVETVDLINECACSPEVTLAKRDSRKHPRCGCLDL